VSFPLTRRDAVRLTLALAALRASGAALAQTVAPQQGLLWNHFVVPHWTANVERTVRWNRFSHPQKMPIYGAAAFPTVWWYDSVKAAATGAPKG